MKPQAPLKSRIKSLWTLEPRLRGIDLKPGQLRREPGLSHPLRLKLVSTCTRAKAWSIRPASFHDSKQELIKGPSTRDHVGGAAVGEPPSDAV